VARFDAIVSDLRMPDMDGAGLWRDVSARHPLLARCMLFVTGDTLSPDAREFLRSSRCASLDKPFSKADLLAQGGGAARLTAAPRAAHHARPLRRRSRLPSSCADHAVQAIQARAPRR
jgi:two-component system NtrC family sensor kinase